MKNKIGLIFLTIAIAVIFFPGKISAIDICTGDPGIVDIQVDIAGQTFLVNSLTYPLGGNFSITVPVGSILPFNVRTFGPPSSPNSIIYPGGGQIIYPGPCGYFPCVRSYTTTPINSPEFIWVELVENCQGPNPPDTTDITITINPSGPICSINSFTCDATDTLAWSTSNCSNVSIDQGIGSVTPGDHNTPGAPGTSYTLTADSQTATRQCPTQALKCSPATQTVNTGANFTMTASDGSLSGYVWKNHANGVTIGNGSTLNYSFPTANTYTIDLYDSLSNQTSCSVTVIPPAAAPTATLTVNTEHAHTPKTFNVGDYPNYAWLSTGTGNSYTSSWAVSPDDGCGWGGLTGSPWLVNNTNGASGSDNTGAIQDCMAGRTFTLGYTATNGSGSNSDLVKIYVPFIAPDPFTATPDSCGTGKITLSWGPSTGKVTGGYTLKRDGTTIYTGPGFTYTDTGLADSSPHTYTIFATNGSGNSTIATRLANAPAACAGNQPPIANAGPDKSITLPVVTSVPTGASSSDSDGTISSTVWSFISGPGPTPTITNGSTLTPSFGNMISAGTYVFRLTATDNQGATGFDDMQVTVNPALVTSGTFTATDCNITSGNNSCNTTLTWNTTNPIGTSAVTTPVGITVATGNSSLGTSYPVAYGTRTFYLYNNAVELANRTVTASCVGGTSWVGGVCAPSANISPTANAGPDKSITQPANSTSVIGTASDPDSFVASTVWTKISGPAATIVSPNALTSNITNLATVGTYVFRLTATDNQGATGFDDMQVTVNPSGGPSATADIKANGSDGPITITSGDLVDITWQSTGATGGCTVTPPGWTGTSATAGTHKLAIFSTVTYRIYCEPPVGGPEDDFVTVNVPVGSFDLCITKSGQGTVDRNPIGTPSIPNCWSYTNGDTVILTENPNPGRIFTGWTVNGVPSGKNTTITLIMDSAKSVIANFAINPNYKEF